VVKSIWKLVKHEVLVLDSFIFFNLIPTQPYFSRTFFLSCLCARQFFSWTIYVAVSFFVSLYFHKYEFVSSEQRKPSQKMWKPKQIKSQTYFCGCREGPLTKKCIFKKDKYLFNDYRLSRN
jgi:hypothetical protein